MWPAGPGTDLPGAGANVRDPDQFKVLAEWARRKGLLLTVASDGQQLMLVKPDGTVLPPVMVQRPNDRLGLEEMAKYLGWSET
jgi:hypothetical protein